MAKKTFENLNAEKREKILQVCKEEFEQHPFHQVKVSDIVDRLGIARGSFYQYFDDLYDCYFTVLSKETILLHDAFLNLLKENDFDLEKTFPLYGKLLEKELFRPDTYGLYKNMFLYWDQDLEDKRKQYQKGNFNYALLKGMKAPHLWGDNPKALMERVGFIKAVVHQLVLGTFVEALDMEAFAKRYAQTIYWLLYGLVPREQV